MSVEQFTLRSSSGAASVVFGVDLEEVETAGYEGPDVSIEIDFGELRAHAVIPAYAVDFKGLAEYFRHMDRDWRGWAGAKEFEAAGSWCALAAEHDGLGHVRLNVTVKSAWPMDPIWTAHATLHMDVGSIRGVAEELETWLVRSTHPTSK
jgi:hypothetical protein